MIPYDRKEIERVVRSILESARDVHGARTSIMIMHSHFESDVRFFDKPVTTFGADGTRTARLALTRGHDPDTMCIAVCVEGAVAA